MRFFLCSVLFLTFGTIFTAQAWELDDQAVKEHCAEEWSNDFAMQKFCIDQSVSGHREFSAKWSSEQDPVMLEAFDNCRHEWGIEWNMVSFCAEQQLSGRGKIPNTLSGLPDDASSAIRTHCESEWPADFAMTAYCVDRAASAWRQINE